MQRRIAVASVATKRRSWSQSNVQIAAVIVLSLAGLLCFFTFSPAAQLAANLISERLPRNGGSTDQHSDRASFGFITHSNTRHEQKGSTYAQVRAACKLGKRRRILVTGAAGFIAFHAAAGLQAAYGRDGDAVIGLDNFNNYYPVSLKRARAAVLESAGVPVVEADLNSAQALQELFSACDFTHVVHLAAQAGVRYATKNPSAYVQSNVAGTVSLLEAMRARSPPAALIFASSSSVYGLTKRFPFSEEDRADKPASLYAATKRSQELITHTYHHLYHISATGLRFFTVYGPWGRPDMSVMAFTRNILEGKAIRVFQGPGGSELARDFTYVQDIVAGIKSAVDNATISTKGTKQFRVLNLGNTQSVTVTDMVRTLEKLLGTLANITYVPVPLAGDVLKTHANISAAHEALGFKPQTGLKAGLTAFVEWHKGYYGPDGSRREPDDVHYIPD